MSKRVLKSDLPPGPRAPSAMQLIATWKRPAASLERLRQRYGTRITVRLPFQPPFVILSDPDEIKELFKAPPDVLHPGEGARVLEPLIGRNSVILLDEGAHLEQRKLMLPAFHGERMQTLAGLMSELDRTRARLLAARAARGAPPAPPAADARDHPARRVRPRPGPTARRATRCPHRRCSPSREPALGAAGAPAVRRRLVPAAAAVRAQTARADALIFDLIEERRAEGDQGRDDVLAMLLQARHEEGRRWRRRSSATS